MGYLWGNFLIAAAALKTPTRNGYKAQGVNLKFPNWISVSSPVLQNPSPKKNINIKLVVLVIMAHHTHTYICIYIC